jgi:hypothetical protein
MYICRDCETEINQGIEICPQCGSDLTKPAPGEDAPKPAPTLRKTLLRWGILLSVLFAALWSFLWFVVPERHGNPTAEAETRAVEALRQVSTALGNYSSAQNGTYPRDIESLDERVHIAAQQAQSANYQIQYTPGPVETDGLIHGYALQARAGNYGFRSFYTDESGALHATKENRAATPQDPLL